MAKRTRFEKFANTNPKGDWRPIETFPRLYGYIFAANKSMNNHPVIVCRNVDYSTGKDLVEGYPFVDTEGKLWAEGELTHWHRIMRMPRFG